METNHRHVRVVLQLVTKAKVKRPEYPKRCVQGAYHLWRWETDPDDPIMQPFTGMECQCGVIKWVYRSVPDSEVKS